jgi:hypothetical protein
MSVHPVTDLALSRRLERAEGRSNAAFVAARARLQPESGAAWQEIGEDVRHVRRRRLAAHADVRARPRRRRRRRHARRPRGVLRRPRRRRVPRGQPDGRRHAARAAPGARLSPRGAHHDPAPAARRRRAAGRRAAGGSGAARAPHRRERGRALGRRVGARLGRDARTRRLHARVRHDHRAGRGHRVLPRRVGGHARGHRRDGRARRRRAARRREHAARRGAAGARRARCSARGCATPPPSAATWR